MAAPVSGAEQAQAPTDFRRIGGVAVGAEAPVGEDAQSLLTMMRVDVFPGDLAFWRDLEHAPPPTPDRTPEAQSAAGHRPLQCVIVLYHHGNRDLEQWTKDIKPACGFYRLLLGTQHTNG